MLVRLSVRSKEQLVCIWSSWCHCIPKPATGEWLSRSLALTLNLFRNVSGSRGAILLLGPHSQNLRLLDCGWSGSYRVRGVDGRCAKHLTVESYTVIICQQSLLFGIPSRITHSLFHSRLKTFLFCKSFLPQPFLFLRDSLHGFPRLFTVISEHVCFLLFSLSVFTLFSCRFCAVD